MAPGLLQWIIQQDGVGVIMNVHFLANMLNSIEYVFVSNA